MCAVAYTILYTNCNEAQTDPWSPRPSCARMHKAEPNATERLLLVDHVDGIEPRRHARGVQAGQYGDAPDQQQRAAQQSKRRMKLDGPAETLLIDHEHQ